MPIFKENDIVKGDNPGLHIILAELEDGYVIDNGLNVLTDAMIARQHFRKVGTAVWENK